MFKPEKYAGIQRMRLRMRTAIIILNAGPSIWYIKIDLPFSCFLILILLLFESNQLKQIAKEY